MKFIEPIYLDGRWIAFHGMNRARFVKKIFRNLCATEHTDKLKLNEQYKTVDSTSSAATVTVVIFFFLLARCFLILFLLRSVRSLWMYTISSIIVYTSILIHWCYFLSFFHKIHWNNNVLSWAPLFFLCVVHWASHCEINARKVLEREKNTKKVSNKQKDNNA